MALYGHVFYTQQVSTSNMLGCLTFTQTDHRCVLENSWLSHTVHVCTLQHPPHLIAKACVNSQ